MIIRTIQMIIEYMSFMLCIHKVAKKKIKFSLEVMIPFFIEWIYALYSNKEEIPVGCKLIIFFGIFLYIKIKVVGTWKKAINVFGVSLLVIMLLQLLQIYLFGVVEFEFNIAQYKGLIINTNICILLLAWREKYSNIIMEKLNRMKGVAIFLLIFVRIIYLLSRNSYADFGIAMQFLFETIGLSVACVLWISAEKEKNHKLREIQMYEMYNQAFEEAIITIRTRQHEFENHINAIRCMQYSIDNHEELLLEQEKYCEKVLQENKLNKLLRLNIEPVLIGFLYSKILSAEENGINTKYEIQAVDIKEKIEINEFIELIGILFDNAVEALEEKECKKIILNLIKEDDKVFSLEIANVSPVYSNSEIEKFCSYGYSTKGEKRGIGLSRTKEIAQKYNIVYQIQNCVYDSDNYLSFKLRFI